jgi:hypothetical protein
MDDTSRLTAFTVGDEEPTQDIVLRGIERLGSVEAKATLELRLLDTEGTKDVTRHSVRLSPEGVSLSAPGRNRPDLVVITTVKAFRDIASGSYSPVQALRGGTLRIEGSVDLGQEILHKLGAQVTYYTCPTLVSGTYNAAEESFSLVGEFFTPGGTVVLDYNVGSSFYQQIVTADSDGTFLATEIGISCGPIPGSQYGVIVTAYDQSSGKSTTKGFTTPC